jgi:anaerobic ribonucleoside-triphosphate reductase activating protein
MNVEDLMEVIMADRFADVTFTGGDPMYQAEGFTELAKAIRRDSKKTIWCYTGFSFEALMRQPVQRALLEQIDVLVDGPFVQSLRDPDLQFRGSSNQRILDVPASLREGKAVVWHDEMRQAI